MTKTPAFLLCLAATAAAAAEPPAPVAISTAPAAGTAPAPAEAFTEEAARRLEVPLDKARDLRRRGFGKTELLVFISVSKAADKPWEDLLKERERGKPLRKMAEDAGLEYNPLFEKARALKREIESSLDGK